MLSYEGSAWIQEQLKEESILLIRVLFDFALYILILFCTKLGHSLQNYLFCPKTNPIRSAQANMPQDPPICKD